MSAETFTAEQMVEAATIGGVNALAAIAKVFEASPRTKFTGATIAEAVRKAETEWPTKMREAVGALSVIDQAEAALRDGDES